MPMSWITLCPSSGRFFKLAVVKIGVETALGQKLVVGALLDDIAVFQHQDQTGVPDGGQPVGDDKWSARNCNSSACIAAYKAYCMD